MECRVSTGFPFSPSFVLRQLGFWAFSGVDHGCCMTEDEQPEFVASRMDSDLPFILSDAGVSRVQLGKMTDAKHP